MLRFYFNQTSARGKLTRREWLRIGGLAGLGSAGLLPSAPAARAAMAGPSGFGRARSVILIFASGGQSQFETWDPKPESPLEVRGDFQPISSAVPGVAICEHLPRVACLTDRLTIVRSMSHDDRDHGSAAYLALTGRFHLQKSGNPLPAADDLPTYGAVLKRVRRNKRFPHDAVHLNGPALVPELIGPGQDGGLLGRNFDPLVLGDVTSGPIAVAGLDPQAGLSKDRLRERLSLKQAMEGSAAALEGNQQALDMNELYRQVYDMLASPTCREAFNLGAEPEQLRDRYGRNRSGQACLLARRLAEAGVPLITVIWNHSNRGQDKAPNLTDEYGWDTHNDIFHAMKTHLLPRFDESFAALIEDLDDRGMLDETLVVCMGEFGRAPRVALEPGFAGLTPGRKHWPTVYSIVLAGAGVQRGAVVGASDRMGAYPVTQRYGPWDVAATMFASLGIDPAGHYLDSVQQPRPITIGQPIQALYG